jgi:hypothetical protein
LRDFDRSCGKLFAGHLFEERAQRGHVSDSIVQREQMLMRRGFRVNPKCLMERTTCKPDGQVSIKHKYGLAHRVDDNLRERACILIVFSNLFHRAQPPRV